MRTVIYGKFGSFTRNPKDSEYEWTCRVLWSVPNKTQPISYSTGTAEFQVSNEALVAVGADRLSEYGHMLAIREFRGRDLLVWPPRNEKWEAALSLASLGGIDI